MSGNHILAQKNRDSCDRMGAGENLHINKILSSNVSTLQILCPRLGVIFSIQRSSLHSNIFY